MALTPEDVVQKRFQATKFREGYDQDEVDDFLDEVVNELRRLNAENDDLRGKLSACERRVGELTRAAAGREANGATGEQPAVQAQTQAQTPAPAPVVEQPAAAEEPEPAREEPRPAPQVAAVAAAGQGQQGPEAAAGMLALAQRLHDEYVRSGEEQRDKIVSEAQEHASRLVREAEDKQRQTLGTLEQERSLLERKIDELRNFERDYRGRLKSYLESQLRDLESRGAVVPNRGSGQRGYGEGDGGQGQFPFGGAPA